MRNRETKLEFIMQVTILILSGIVLFAVSILAFIILFTKQQKVIVPAIGIILGIAAIAGAWVLGSRGMQIAPFTPSKKPAAGDIPTYTVGETWTVEGQWMLTIVDIKETEYRSEFEDWDPDIVYEVDYQYTNLGYERDNSNGIYFYLDYSGTDAKGMETKYYSGNTAYFPKTTPVGATCYAQNFIAVSERGPVTFDVLEYGSDGTAYRARFIADPDSPRSEVDIPKIEINDEPLKVGETWTVDGQWNLTINAVTETTERNNYSELNPEKVYIIDYTYENIGYKDNYGLYLYLDGCIVDSTGLMGYSYPVGVDSYPATLQPGEVCHAQTAVGLDHAGNFRIYMNEYDDSNDGTQKQVFLIETE